MAIQFVLPKLGAIYDAAKLQRAGGEAAFASLQPGSKLNDVLAFAAARSFQAVAVIPVVLFVIFGIVWALERKQKLGGIDTPAT
jgi:hypothetical protein